MKSSVYRINKGINKPIEFKGLKAQYIWYLGGGVMMLLVLFAMLYIIGVNMFVCLAIIALLGVLLFMAIYHLSNTYGQHGLTKRFARYNIPKVLINRSRRQFFTLKK